MTDKSEEAPVVDIDQLRAAYKQAKKEYKSNKDDETLKKKMKDAKKALEEAAAAAADKNDKSAEAGDSDAPENEGAQSADDAGKGQLHVVPAPESASTDDIPSLQKAYDEALAAFKADKSNKDLRRWHAYPPKFVSAVLSDWSSLLPVQSPSVFAHSRP